MDQIEHLVFLSLNETDVHFKFDKRLIAEVTERFIRCHFCRGRLEYSGQDDPEERPTRHENRQPRYIQYSLWAFRKAMQQPPPPGLLEGTILAAEPR